MCSPLNPRCELSPAGRRVACHDHDAGRWWATRDWLGGMLRFGSIGILKDSRRTITQAGMTATQVVPAFQICKNRVSGLVVGLKPAACKQFTFKRGEKTFAHGVVKAVANAAHRRTHTGLKATPAEGDRRVLATLDRSHARSKYRS